MAFQSPVTSQQNLSMNSAQASNPIVQMIFQRYTEAKRYRRVVDAPWDRWYRRYAGFHWDTPRPSYRSSPTINFIFSTIETMVPIMTDRSPQITVIGARQDSTPLADLHSMIQRRIWVDNDMDLVLPTIVRTSLKYGTGIAKAYWDDRMGPPDADGNPQGDVAVCFVDPKHFYVSPGATSMKNANYVLFAANLPVATVEAQYHVKIEEPGIWDEDLTVSKTAGGAESQGIAATGPIQTTDGTATSWPVGGTPGQPQMDRSALCTLVELWYKENDQVTCVIAANGQILKGPIQPKGYKQFPFVTFIDYSVPSMFWGMGEIQQLEPIQDSINKRRGQIIDILRLTANPPIVADSDSGINPKALTTRPGLIIFKNRGSEIKWLNPPVIPAALFELQALDKQDFDGISGVYDVTQGKRPTGIEAASAIAELQEAAQTRIRAKVRNMEASLRNLGRIILDLVQAFYTQERTIRIVGAPAGQNQFVTLNQEVIEGDAVKRINDVTVGEFDIEVGVGSTMPVNKTRRFEQMLQLYQLGIVDAQAVREYTGLSQEEVMRITNRMQKEQALMQGAATPEAEPTAGGPPPSEEELAMFEQQLGR